MFESVESFIIWLGYAAQRAVFSFTYLFTYLLISLQPRFGQGMSEKIPSLYSILSEVYPGTDSKSPAIVVHAIHLS
jgi:hypothetical protein